MVWKVVTVAAAMLLLAWWGPSCAGMEATDPVVPQFIVGTLAGYVGGFGGAYALSGLLMGDCSGWECLGRAILGAVIGFTGGTTLGAFGGVWATGAILEAEGNLGLCFLGAVGGTGAVVGFGFVVQLPELLWLAAPAASAGATGGYNVRTR